MMSSAGLSVNNETKLINPSSRKHIATEMKNSFNLRDRLNVQQFSDLLGKLKELAELQSLIVQRINWNLKAISTTQNDVMSAVEIIKKHVLDYDWGPDLGSPLTNFTEQLSAHNLYLKPLLNALQENLESVKALLQILVSTPTDQAATKATLLDQLAIIGSSIMIILESLQAKLHQNDFLPNRFFLDDKLEGNCNDVLQSLFTVLQDTDRLENSPEQVEKLFFVVKEIDELKCYSSYSSLINTISASQKHLSDNTVLSDFSSAHSSVNITQLQSKEIELESKLKDMYADYSKGYTDKEDLSKLSQVIVKLLDEQSDELITELARYVDQIDQKATNILTTNKQEAVSYYINLLNYTILMQQYFPNMAYKEQTRQMKIWLQPKLLLEETQVHFLLIVNVFLMGDMS